MTDEQAAFIAAALALAATNRGSQNPVDDEFDLADRVASIARVLYADIRSASREREHADLAERLAFVSGLRSETR